jgi:hypothetical protein
VLVAAASVATFRFGAFPRWVGWLGFLDALVFLVGAYTIATTSDAINTFAFVGFILWAIWLVATSIVMYRANYDAPAPAIAGDGALPREAAAGV